MNKLLQLILCLFGVGIFPHTCFASCKGCLEMDHLTFDKILRRFPAAIVKFDIAYPYGDKHEAYSEFAANVAEQVDDLAVAVVGIKDYGELDNSNLGKRFKVRDVYPDIKLFVGGNFDKWIDYPTGLSLLFVTAVSVFNLQSNFYL